MSFVKVALLLCAMVAFSLAEVLSPLAAYGYAETDLIEKVDISGDGGIVKYIVRQGEGAPAKKGAQISAHYDGKLTDGKGFDSSRKRGQPFKFGLGGGQVIKGWDRGFDGMKVGEKAVLEITAQYVSGAARARPPCPRSALPHRPPLPTHFDARRATARAARVVSSQAGPLFSSRLS